MACFLSSLCLPCCFWYIHYRSSTCKLCFAPPAAPSASCFCRHSSGASRAACSSCSYWESQPGCGGGRWRAGSRTHGRRQICSYARRCRKFGHFCFLRICFPDLLHVSGSFKALSTGSLAKYLLAASSSAQHRLVQTCSWLCSLLRLSQKGFQRSCRAGRWCFLHPAPSY